MEPGKTIPKRIQEMKKEKMIRLAKHPKHLWEVPWEFECWVYDGEHFFAGLNLAIANTPCYISDTKLGVIPDEWQILEYSTGQLLTKHTVARRANAPTPLIQAELERAAEGNLIRAHKEEKSNLPIDAYLAAKIRQAEKLNP